MATKPTYEELEQRVKELETEARDRKQEEKILHHFQRAVDAASGAIGMSTPEGLHFYQNKAFDEWFGNIGEDPPGSLYVDERVGREVFETIIKGSQWTGEVGMFSKNRDILDIFLRAYSIKDQNNKVIGLVGVHTDITERKRSEVALQEAYDQLEIRVEERTAEVAKANEQLKMEIEDRKEIEKALRESEKRFRTMIDTALEGIWVSDKDGRTTYVNLRITELLGYSFDEMLGKKVSEFLHDEHTEIFEVMQYRQTEGASNQYDLRFRRKDGKELWGIVSSNPLFDPEGNVAGGFSMVTDITDRKHAKDEKKKLEARLLRAQKMEAIGTLAGSVAHDLNNVLSGLVSYPDLLLMDLPDDSPLRKAVLTIQDSGKKAAAIVQDLLTLARRGVDVSEVTNLNDVISDYLTSPEYEKLQTFYPGAQTETDLQGDLLNVLGSTVHLSKTVMNLVSNAVESLRDGGIVTISTKNEYIDRPMKGYDEVEEGDYVVLRVDDNGIGIAREDLDKIFEPFYSKKVMGKSGTGLGMAVVWGTVKDHNGYIDVKSEEGKGTVFELYFPVTRREMEKEQSALFEDYRGNGEKILVVDDIEQQRDIATVLLTKLGYSIDTVSNGEEAIKYMKDNSVDLLVLDMIMSPGIDGLDTYKKILELHPGQKAIIASGFSETYRVKKAQRLGAGQYVKKPYTLEKIGLAVKAELDK